MPLKKKDRDRLFEKDLEKGENNTVAHCSILRTNAYVLCTALLSSIQLARVHVNILRAIADRFIEIASSSRRRIRSVVD